MNPTALDFNIEVFWPLGECGHEPCWFTRCFGSSQAAEHTSTFVFRRRWFNQASKSHHLQVIARYIVSFRSADKQKASFPASLLSAA
jgi:hypothetical protein